MSLQMLPASSLVKGSLIRCSVFVQGIMLPRANVPLTKQTKIIESHSFARFLPLIHVKLLAFSSSVSLHSSLLSVGVWSHISSFKTTAVVWCSFPSNLVLPLGLLGQHLLHAERGQTDSEGGQQSRRSNRCTVGRFWTGNFVYLYVVQPNGVSCNLGSLHSLLADVFFFHYKCTAVLRERN